VIENVASADALHWIVVQHRLKKKEIKMPQSKDKPATTRVQSRPSGPSFWTAAYCLPTWEK
jgi:hypothetical protein